MSDVRFNFGSFSSTQVEFAAQSAAARAVFAEQFGAAAVSVNVKKSESPRFADFLQARGLTVEAAQ